VVVVPVQSPAVPRDARSTNVVRALGRAVSARVYLPACAIAVPAAALIGIVWFIGWGGANFSGSLQDLHLVVVGPASLIVIGLILVVERLRPAQRRPLVARGHRQGVLYALLHFTLGVLLITALTLSFEEVIRRAVP